MGEIIDRFDPQPRSRFEKDKGNNGYIAGTTSDFNNSNADYFDNKWQKQILSIKKMTIFKFTYYRLLYVLKVIYKIVERKLCYELYEVVYCKSVYMTAKMDSVLNIQLNMLNWNY